MHTKLQKTWGNGLLRKGENGQDYYNDLDLTGINMMS
jgi:hypothetical protein